MTRDDSFVTASLSGVAGGKAAPAPPHLVRSYWPSESEHPLAELTVGQALREAVDDAPDRVALIEGIVGPSARRWTYSELLARAVTIAHALLERFRPGDRVAVWANNLPEWVQLEYGAAMAGVTIVTVNPALRKDELRHVLSQSHANGIFLIPTYRGNDMLATLDAVRTQLPHLTETVLFTEWDEFVADPVRRLLPEVDPRDAAQIQYTSGTTGVPKGAILHHRGIVNNARLYASRVGLPDGSVQVSPMPLFHTAGCVMSVLGALAVRGTLVLPPAFDPSVVLDLSEAHGADALLGVPTMLLATLDDEQFPSTDLSRLRRVLSGGAVVPQDLIRRIENETRAVVGVVFAQTEASPVITATSPYDSPADRAETLGQPLPHTEVKIVDPSNQRVVATNTVGELCTRGYHVMTGYFGDAVATDVAVDPERWLHTGDLVSMDDRGYCRIEGRLKDMIIRGGENIYPREVEEVVLGHQDVSQVAVVGVPDPHWGEQVAAFIRLKDGRVVHSDALEAFCRRRLARHKCPRHWVVVDDFPLTGSGKVQKYVLREQFVALHREEGTVQ